jgi:hypothetical protein
MITWIAGWPHNGSTLLRQIIKETTGLPSASKYPEKELEHLFPGSLAWAERFNSDHMRQYLYYSNLREGLLVKTHEAPIDKQNAIFVIRDGRDAITALSRFYKIPLRDIIIAQGMVFGDWSGFYWAWEPHKRPFTLIVRFEDMVNKPNEVAKRVATFLGVEIRAEFVDRYEEDAKNYMGDSPLYNGRIGIWKEDFWPDDLELFWKCHGAVMKICGYDDREIEKRKGPQRQVFQPNGG